jgi:hypothetical protein
VGIAKYTALPDVSVEVSNNNSIITLTGTYKTEDVTEKLYSSYFVIKDSYKISIKTSDDKKFTLSVNKSDEEYALKHQNIHIGNLKLIDMMTCTL